MPSQLIHPPLQVVDHDSYVGVVPQPLQAFLQKIGLEHPPVDLEKPVRLSAMDLRQVLPPAQQLPFLSFDESPLLGSLPDDVRLSPSIAVIAGTLHDEEL